MNDTMLILPSWLKIEEISRIVLWEKAQEGNSEHLPIVRSIAEPAVC